MWRGRAWQGACVVVGGVCVAGKTAIAPGSTHPTGMHSCYDKFFPVVTKKVLFFGVAQWKATNKQVCILVGCVPPAC